MDENNKQQNTPDLKEKTSKIQNIHTYQSDMADLVRNEEASVIKISLAEQKRKVEQTSIAEGKISNPKNILWILGGIIFIIFAILGVVFLTKKTTTDSIVTPIVTKIQGLISYDDQSIIDVTNITTKDEFVKLVKTELEKKPKTGLIKAIFLKSNDKLLTTNEFLNLAKLNMPGNLSRSLEDQFMMGTFFSKKNNSNLEEKQHLFLIFKTTSYSQAFAGILEWEKIMFSDLFSLFNIEITAERQTLVETPFKDLIIQNKDVRTLVDVNGVSVLYYLFIGNDTFIITDNQEAIKEITLRLITKNIKPL
jgi:hypothetical protein